MQLPPTAQNIIASKYQPVVLVFAQSGYIDIYLTLTGNLVNRIGPFGNFKSLFFHELEKKLCIFHKNLKIYILNIKVDFTETDKNNLGYYCRPVIIHNFTSIAEKSPLTEEEINIIKSMKLMLKDYLKGRNLQAIGGLEKLAEEVKSEIDLGRSKEFLTMMKVVCKSKYELGVENIGFNLIFEEFSLCNLVENKFDLLIQHAAISPDRRFFAVANIPGNLRIFSTTNDCKLIHLIADVIFFRTKNFFFDFFEKILESWN